LRQHRVASKVIDHFFVAQVQGNLDQGHHHDTAIAINGLGPRRAGLGKRGRQPRLRRKAHSATVKAVVKTINSAGLTHSFC
jgi:hypothetical protein